MEGSVAPITSHLDPIIEFAAAQMQASPGKASSAFVTLLVDLLATNAEVEGSASENPSWTAQGAPVSEPPDAEEGPATAPNAVAWSVSPLLPVTAPVVGAVKGQAPEASATADPQMAIPAASGVSRSPDLPTADEPGIAPSAARPDASGTPQPVQADTLGIAQSTEWTDSAGDVEGAYSGLAEGIASESQEPQRASQAPLQNQPPAEGSSVSAHVPDEASEAAPLAATPENEPQVSIEGTSGSLAGSATGDVVSPFAEPEGESPPASNRWDSGGAVRAVGSAPERPTEPDLVTDGVNFARGRGPEVARAVDLLEPQQRGARGVPRASDVARNHADAHSALQRGEALAGLSEAPPSGSGPHSTTSAPSVSPSPPTSSLPEPLQPVLDAIVELDRSGGEARIHLDPPELGEVFVRIHRGADGLAIEVRVERPDALQLFVTHRSAFELQLAQRGIALGGLAIDLASSWDGHAAPREDELPARADGTFAALVAGSPAPNALQRRARLAYNPDGRLVLWA